MPLQIRRVYESPSEDEGYRVLIDRLWPRGLRKDQVELDIWLKDVAPSTELRRWFGHDPSKWSEFKVRYFRELDGQPQAIADLVDRARNGRVTLLFGAKDAEHSNAAALVEYLSNKLEK